jgi:hypothetical protein
MTKAEMLERSRLSEADFQQLVQRYQSFLGSLNPAQLAAVDRWMPTAAHIAASFGPALTVERLADIVGADPCSSTAIAQRGVGLGAPSNNAGGNGGS